MTNYKIESGIPVPPRFHYPFSTMKPDDSFFITTSQPKEIAAVRAAISYYKRHHKGTNFVSRIQREANHITGIRIFRTS